MQAEIIFKDSNPWDLRLLKLLKFHSNFYFLCLWLKFSLIVAVKPRRHLFNRLNTIVVMTTENGKNTKFHRTAMCHFHALFAFVSIGNCSSLWCERGSSWNHTHFSWHTFVCFSLAPTEWIELNRNEIKLVKAIILFSIPQSNCDKRSSLFPADFDHLRWHHALYLTFSHPIPRHATCRRCFFNSAERPSLSDTIVDIKFNDFEK